jgi:hypothetical protein
VRCQIVIVFLSQTCREQYIHMYACEAGELYFADMCTYIPMYIHVLVLLCKVADCVEISVIYFARYM